MQFTYPHNCVFLLLDSGRALSSMSILFYFGLWCSFELPSSQNSQQIQAKLLQFTTRNTNPCFYHNRGKLAFIHPYSPLFQQLGLLSVETSLIPMNHKVPDAYSLYNCYHSISQAWWDTIPVLLWRWATLLFAGPLTSVLRPHSSEKNSFHMFCFLTDSFGHCSETCEL